MEPSAFKLITWLKMLRIHQWIKNLLLFIPLIAANQFTNSTQWIHLLVAFFSFSFCTSAVYIINDLSDLENDRKHPQNKNRPFASGKIPTWAGIALIPFLLFICVILASCLGGSFLIWLAVYFVLTCIYSWGLKKLALIDCLMLAFFYTLRILAGGSVVHIKLSFWLLGFSIFLFLSLAFVKRYTELNLVKFSLIDNPKGRGYYLSDSSLIKVFGVSSGYCAVLLLALYLNSTEIIHLYKTPEYIWGAVPLMMMWVSWVWMQADRGKMHDDPILFAIKDTTSLLIGLLLTILFVLAKLW